MQLSCVKDKRFRKYSILLAIFCSALVACHLVYLSNNQGKYLKNVYKSFSVWYSMVSNFFLIVSKNQHSQVSQLNERTSDPLWPITSEMGRSNQSLAAALRTPTISPFLLQTSKKESQIRAANPISIVRNLPRYRGDQLTRLNRSSEETSASVSILKTS